MEHSEHFAELEFEALRHTIATRGTVRIVLAAVTIFCWTAAALVLMLFSDLPVAAVLSLAILVGGFEAVHALHAGVERIGRYLQVFYEERGGKWETIAMKVGPALPGGGVDPLFTIVFISAATLNLMPAMLPAPTPIEIGVITVVHLLFVIRIVRARSAAARQREVELKQFQALRHPVPAADAPPTSGRGQ